jgi:hypothetical protein
MVSGEAGAMWDVIVQFVGQCNIPIATAASPEFHQVIEAAFVGGFECALKNPKANVDRDFAKFCPPRNLRRPPSRIDEIKRPSCNDGPLLMVTRRQLDA